MHMFGMGGGLTIEFLLLVLLPMAVSMFVSWRFKSKARHYAKLPLTSGLTGREVAEKMLHDSGIHDVKVISVNRSEERRVGKECVSTCRSRWSQYHSKKKENI